jgi:hypothetical protein
VKFLCLGYYDPSAFDKLSADDAAALGDACRPHDAALRATGHLSHLLSLEHRKAVTLRARGGRTVTTDGPFVETKEQVGSLFILEAADLGEAIRLASLHPAARMREDLSWAVEVRPIEFFAEY